MKGLIPAGAPACDRSMAMAASVVMLWTSAPVFRQVTTVPFLTVSAAGANWFWSFISMVVAGLAWSAAAGLPTAGPAPVVAAPPQAEAKTPPADPKAKAAPAKKDAKKGGILQFGTELVAAEDGTIAALLGASPGASVTVSIMLNLIERCFAEQARSESWASKLREIFPAREKVLEEDAALYREVAAASAKALQLA